MTTLFEILGNQKCRLKGEELQCYITTGKHDNERGVILGVEKPIDLKVLKGLTCADFPSRTEITSRYFNASVPEPDLVLVFTESKEIHIARSFNYKQWRHSWHLSKFVREVRECFVRENSNFGTVVISDKSDNAFADLEFIFSLKSDADLFAQISAFITTIEKATENAFESMRRSLLDTGDKKNISLFGELIRVKAWSKGPIEFNLPKVLEYFRKKRQ